jgi:hypothetical protein
MQVLKMAKRKYQDFKTERRRARKVAAQLDNLTDHSFFDRVDSGVVVHPATVFNPQPKKSLDGIRR